MSAYVPPKSDAHRQAEAELAKMSAESFDALLERVDTFVSQLDHQLSSDAELLMVADRIAQMFDLFLLPEEYRSGGRGRPAGSLTMKKKAEALNNRAAAYAVRLEEDEYLARTGVKEFPAYPKDDVIEIAAEAFNVGRETVREGHRRWAPKGMDEQQLFPEHFLPFLHNAIARIKDARKKRVGEYGAVSANHLHPPPRGT